MASKKPTAGERIANKYGDFEWGYSKHAAVKVREMMAIAIDRAIARAVNSATVWKGRKSNAK